MKLNLTLVTLIVLAFAASLLAGRIWLPLASLLSPHDSLAGLIIFDVRLPRTILALIVGAVLGLSGAALQGFTRNPLAEPALRTPTCGTERHSRWGACRCNPSRGRGDRWRMARWHCRPRRAAQSCPRLTLRHAAPLR